MRRSVDQLTPSRDIKVNLWIVLSSLSEFMSSKIINEPRCPKGETEQTKGHVTALMTSH